MAKITILMVLIAENLKKSWSLTQFSISGWWGEPAEPEKRGAGKALMMGIFIKMREAKTCIITTLMTFMAMTLLIIRDL